MLTTLQHYYNWRKTLQRWLEAYRSKFVEVRNAEFCSQAEKLWDRKGARIEHVIKKDLRQAWFEVILRILVLNCLYFMNMLVLLLWDKWFLRYRHIGVGYTLFWTTLYLPRYRPSTQCPPPHLTTTDFQVLTPQFHGRVFHGHGY